MILEASVVGAAERPYPFSLVEDRVLLFFEIPINGMTHIDIFPVTPTAMKDYWLLTLC